MTILIIGQGLTGSLLAMALQSHGHTVHILDNTHYACASKVAAGIMNPLTGPRLSLTWPNPAHLDFTLSHYKKLESQLKISLIHPLTMIKQLITPLEKISLEKKQTQQVYSTLFKSPVPNITNGYFIPIHRLDTPTLLTKTAHHLKSTNSLIHTQFTHNDLLITKNKIQWKALKADSIIFCEGFQGETNPLFQHLNFKNSKGELIHFTSDNLPQNTLFNHGKWSCSLTKNHHIYGSTAYWDYSPTPVPEEPSTSQLKEHLSQWLKSPYKITKITAGIRPIMHNRKPAIKTHPTHPHVHMINGLGGHGCYLAPHIITQAIHQFGYSITQNKGRA